VEDVEDERLSLALCDRLTDEDMKAVDSSNQYAYNSLLDWFDAATGKRDTRRAQVMSNALRWLEMLEKREKAQEFQKGIQYAREFGDLGKLLTRRFLARLQEEHLPALLKNAHRLEPFLTAERKEVFVLRSLNEKGENSAYWTHVDDMHDSACKAFDRMCIDVNWQDQQSSGQNESIQKTCTFGLDGEGFSV